MHFERIFLYNFVGNLNKKLLWTEKPNKIVNSSEISIKGIKKKLECFSVDMPRIAGGHKYLCLWYSHYIRHKNNLHSFFSASSARWNASIQEKKRGSGRINERIFGKRSDYKKIGKLVVNKNIAWDKWCRKHKIKT